jgi:hypothetical protein
MFIHWRFSYIASLSKAKYYNFKLVAELLTLDFQDKHKSISMYFLRMDNFYFTFYFSCPRAKDK